jgi:transcriptional regulator with XRE-family HTH domain
MPSKKSSANQALGGALRAIRLERGLNQEVFASHAGLARSNYGAIERGEFNVTLDTIVKLAAGLGLSVAELLSRASADGRERSDAV